VKQVTARELKTIYQRAFKQECLDTILILRLIATIRHLRSVIRRQRDAMKP
jgi:hypothetical protein